MNHQEVHALIGAIHNLWPTVKFAAQTGPDMVRQWQLVLADVPYEAAEVVVVTRARLGDEFPPTPGKLAKHYHDAVAQATGSRAPDADEAWAEVMVGVQRRGFQQGPPTWSHPAVAAAVQSVSWREICLGETMITRAHFLKLYPAVLARSVNATVQQQTLEALGGGPVVGVLPRRSTG